MKAQLNTFPDKQKLKRFVDSRTCLTRNAKGSFFRLERVTSGSNFESAHKNKESINVIIKTIKLGVMEGDGVGNDRNQFHLLGGGKLLRKH